MIPTIPTAAAVIRQGPKGDKGDTGVSAYEAAVQQGFVGTTAQWIASLEGDAGTDAFELLLTTQPNVLSGDANFDNAPGINAALAVAEAAGKKLVIPPGNWYYGTDITLTGNMEVFCAPGCNMMAMAATYPKVIHLNSATTPKGWVGGYFYGSDDSNVNSVAHVFGSTSSYDLNPVCRVTGARCGTGIYDFVRIVAECDQSIITNNSGFANVGRAMVWGEVTSDSPAPTSSLHISGNHFAGQNSRVLGKNKYGIHLRGFEVPNISNNIINGFDVRFDIDDNTTSHKSTESVALINNHSEDFRPFINDPVARANSTAYTVGQECSYGYNVYTCTIAGTSGASSPTFNTTIGNTTVDGTVTWQCVSKHSARWTTGRVVAIGDLVKPNKTASMKFSAVWQATVGGTTGATEPAGLYNNPDVDYGTTVTDNDITWTLIAKSIDIQHQSTSKRVMTVQGHRCLNGLVSIRLAGKASINVENLACVASSQGDTDVMLAIGTLTETVSAKFENCILRGNIWTYFTTPSSPASLVCLTVLDNTKTASDSVADLCVTGDGVYGAYTGIIEPSFGVQSKSADYTVDWKKDAFIRCNHTDPITVTVGSPTLAQRGHVLTIQNASSDIPLKIDLTGMNCNIKGKLTTVLWLTRAGEVVKLRALSANSVEIDSESLTRFNDVTGLLLDDNFLGLSIDTTKWQTTLGSDPQCAAAIYEENSGTLRLTTGDDAGATMALNGVQFNGALNWRPQNGGLVFQTAIKLSANGNIAVFCGLTDQRAALEMPFTLGAGDTLTSNASDAVGFLYDTAADTDYLHMVGVKADVDAIKQNTGAAILTATWTILRIEVSTAGVARFFVNSALVGTAMTDAVTPTAILTPVIATLARSSTGKNVDVAYVRVAQD